VNCAAFTPTLLESELFGHVKGAFTGALSSRKGIFAQAHGGTLFLDEVAELPLDLQAKLLRVLQERTFVPVGATEAVRTDVRIIAATHRALREEARAGRFREDLMFRLRVVPIFLPALRQRPADIELLTLHFIEAFNQRGVRIVHAIDPAVLRALAAQDWPGNVRELQNVLEYAFAVGRSPVLDLHDLPPDFRAERPVAVAADSSRVTDALRAADGDLDRAAALLGVSRTTFWRMRKRLANSEDR
jgi:transcriptional regulator with PAS, ATPase and Fis domain